MSDQEKTSGEDTDRGTSVIVVETGSTRYTGPYKSSEIQDEMAPEPLQKRALVVASVTEKLKEKDSTEKTAFIDTDATKDNMTESDHGMSSERHKNIAKKFSQVASIKRDTIAAPVSIPLTNLETGSNKPADVKPIPPSTWKARQSGTPKLMEQDKIKEDIETKDDSDSITSEITAVRTPEDKKPSDWSDDEEASGLPRTESRASRVTRAVRQLLCCGVQLEAPSEDHMSSPRSGFFNSGI